MKQFDDTILYNNYYYNTILYNTTSMIQPSHRIIKLLRWPLTIGLNIMFIYTALNLHGANYFILHKII